MTDFDPKWPHGHQLCPTRLEADAIASVKLDAGDTRPEVNHSIE